ncbi:LOW QUALITY PROTEIN: multimodular transpeptidase-transglycosylase [Bacillus sp. JCM 19045]|nr:LOW QUALITY PROTEIN: multimodular transpeptidase-transglycosylase [Bacillus sp. JCM 19045]
MKTIVGWGFVALFAFLSIFLFTYATAEVSSVQSVSHVVSDHIDRDALYLSSNSTITDEDGRVIAELVQDTNRIYLPYSNMPENVIHSFVATEDRRFFDHHGFDVSGMARAFLANVDQGGIDQGASTITQQMVRNIFLDHSRTYERKISELLYAYELEQQYSKEEILELYLNSIFFGNNAYGIEAASQLYFSETVSNLSLAQVAFLTAIPNNPTYYDPLTNGENTNQRKEWVLEKMKQEGYISESDYVQAIDEPIDLHQSKRANLYPDYSDLVLEEMKWLIAEVEGLSGEELMTRLIQLYNQGIQIETALESDRQQRLVDSFYHELPEDVLGSAIVIDHQNNTIVAIGNGRNYQKGNLMYALHSYRPHGSVFKPLIDYAPYIEETGASLDMMLNGNPLSSCSKEDYDKRSLGCVTNYNDVRPGTISLKEAFKQSYNIPAQYLLNETGIDNAITTLEPMNFSKMQDEKRELSLALGALDVSVFEMGQAYTAFSRDGQFTHARAITGVYDEHGNLLYEWPVEEPAQIWSYETNEKMRELLKEVVDSGTGRHITIDQDGYVGGKTGTTSLYRDLAFSGMTDQYTASVWVGRDEGFVEDLGPQRPAMNIWAAAIRN